MIDYKGMTELSFSQIIQASLGGCQIEWFSFETGFSKYKESCFVLCAKAENS
ncbi:MAG: hypothetical protein J0L67_03800 [Cytophagales bacterium]|nr:hypothetical protein [Cytophagales bacterium]